MTADGIDVTKAFTAGAPVSPELFRTPTPAPAIFEWRQHVQQKLSNMEDELMHLRRNMLPPDGQEAAKGPQETPAQRNLRLLKEIEDEEEAFQRKTTKLAMEMARVESDKVMSKTVTVEAFAKQMHEKMEALQATFTQEIEQGRKREDALQAQLASVMTENKRLALTVEEVLKEQKVAAKHRNDLEEAIFYLQDEILKTKPKPPPTPQIDPKTAAKKKK